MKPFLTPSEEESLVAGIREQESRTGAEIRVCVTYKWIWRHERYAWKVFKRTGMNGTRLRNGALIVMMPRMRKVVVIGDKGFDEVVSPAFWRDAVDSMVKKLHEENPLEALLLGLRILGDELARHWPREDGDINELPDDIIR